jgi:hypothetical protein
MARSRLRDINDGTIEHERVDLVSDRRQPVCRRRRLIQLTGGTIMAFDYDLFVIGGGSGGVRAARVAARRPAPRWRWPRKAAWAAPA